MVHLVFQKQKNGLISQQLLLLDPQYLAQRLERARQAVGIRLRLGAAVILDGPVQVKQALQHAAVELGQLVEKEHTVVRETHLTGARFGTTTDESRISSEESALCDRLDSLSDLLVSCRI